MLSLAPLLSSLPFKEDIKIGNVSNSFSSAAYPNSPSPSLRIILKLSPTSRYYNHGGDGSIKQKHEGDQNTVSSSGRDCGGTEENKQTHSEEEVKKRRPRIIFTCRSRNNSDHIEDNPIDKGRSICGKTIHYKNEADGYKITSKSSRQTNDNGEQLLSDSKKFFPLTWSVTAVRGRKFVPNKDKKRKQSIELAESSVSKEKKAKLLEQITSTKSSGKAEDNKLVTVGFQSVNSYKNMLDAVTDINQKSQTSCENKFGCTICDKSFSTHQALGGHKSSHYKKIAVGSKSSGQITNLTLALGGHKCKFCDKSFPTGQALGGHQRLHRAAPSAPKVLTRTTSSCTIKYKKTFDFDLNELPVMEGEEADLDISIAPASSSGH